MLIIIFISSTHTYINAYEQVLWLTICTAAIGCMPEGETKRRVVHIVLIQCFTFLSSAISGVINYHDIQNRPTKTGICVANHTSPIDVLVLMCNNCYSLVSYGINKNTYFVHLYVILFFSNF